MAATRTDLRIEPMAAADIDAVVRLQIATLPDSLVTQLGARFLRRFHARALGDAGTIALVARTRDGALAGFTVGTTDGGRFRQRMRAGLLVQLALALLARPALARRFALSLLQREPPSPVAAELLLLAVHDDHRRRHVGSDLLDGLERRFLALGVSDYRVAVRSWLAPAIGFYRRLAFEVEAEADVLGAPMTYLRRRIHG
jgi:ribosomal protein S18 acetylase RimI-like enzyme